MCKHYIKFKTKQNVENVINAWNMNAVDQFRVKVAHYGNAYSEFTFVLEKIDDKTANSYMDFIKEKFDKHPEWHRVNNDFNIGDDIECTEMQANN